MASARKMGSSVRIVRPAETVNTTELRTSVWNTTGILGGGAVADEQYGSLAERVRLRVLVRQPTQPTTSSVEAVPATAEPRSTPKRYQAG